MVTWARTGTCQSIPTMGNTLALALGDRHELWGSALQLIINLTGMGVAGWATLMR